MTQDVERIAAGPLARCLECVGPKAREDDCTECFASAHLTKDTDHDSDA